MGHGNTRKLLGFALVVLALAACDCDDGVLVPIKPGACEPTYVCPTGFEYRRGECRTSRCQIDADCCPGQKCTAGTGFCGDQLRECSRDEQCAEIPDQRCIELRDGRYCGYPNRGNSISLSGTQPCASNADCDDGRTCFGNRCLIYAPCEGGCPEGQICDVDTNTCFEDERCSEACGAGQMLVLADPDRQSGPLCCQIDCKCETLPPVLPGQYGFYADVAAAGQVVAVSAYDSAYGDLVVVRYDADGRVVRVDYVDGFPLDAPVVGNPTGPRNGRDEPGPDVGEHTSIAIDALGVVHVAYYDRTNGDLKYAHDGMSGRWTTQVVDAQGDVGLYTSISIGPDGSPKIAYFMAQGTVNGDTRTGLKLASARTPLPMSPSDWLLEVVDSRPKPPLICNGRCPGGEACVDLPSGPACAAESGACAGGCGMNQACVVDGGSASCLRRVNPAPFDDLIEGVGLFASLAHTSTGTPMVAYYDRIAGDLKLATGRGPGAGFRIETLDGDAPNDPTDVGQHASLAVGPGDRAAVAYYDATEEDLVYLDLETRTREVVDRGVTPPDLRLVGADASLIFDAAGEPAIAYQDPTFLDLLYARRSAPAMWTTEVVWGGIPASGGQGTASGFYAAQARLGDKAYVCSTDVTFDEESNLLLHLQLLVKGL